MTRHIPFLISVTLLASAVPVHAANHVRVESKTVCIGATDVEIGVFFENDVKLSLVALPLEIRSIAGEAYFTGRFEFRRGWCDDRINDCSPFPHPTLNFYDLPQESNECSGPISHSWPGFPVGGGVGAQMDAMFWVPVSLVSGFLPGSDGATPSARFKFDIGQNVGAFEIDTCCILPSNHLNYVAYETSLGIIPTFTKGVITVACECPMRGDLAGDNSVLTATDVVVIVDYVFRDGPPPATDALCPSINRADVDCNRVTDVLDVVRMVNVAYRGADPTTEFCDPCAVP